jgi:hypothetical protein
MRSSARAPILIAMRTNAPDATFTNGRYERPASARGMLVLADPPEAGWRIRTISSEQATADTELLAVAGRGRDGQEARGACALEGGERG